MREIEIRWKNESGKINWKISWKTQGNVYGKHALYFLLLNFITLSKAVFLLYALNVEF
jgi:hypothetical protein